MIRIILEDLKARYGDKVMLSPEDLVGLLDMSVGQQANRRREGTFPVKTRKVGNRVFVTIYDLAKYLSSSCETDVADYVKQESVSHSVEPDSRKAKKSRKGHLEKNWWLKVSSFWVPKMDMALGRFEAEQIAADIERILNR